jgi:hypothetical protein
MADTKEDFGHAFSDKAVSQETRLSRVSSILDAVHSLNVAIMNQGNAQLLADTHIGQANFTDPTWDRFLANTAVDPGINRDVQLRAEEVWTAVHNLVV